MIIMLTSVSNFSPSVLSLSDIGYSSHPYIVDYWSSWYGKCEDHCCITGGGGIN